MLLLMSFITSLKESRTDIISSLFSKVMLSHISALEDAILVMSLKPPAARRCIYSLSESSFLTLFTRAAAIMCGTWLIDATA